MRVKGLILTMAAVVVFSSVNFVAADETTELKEMVKSLQARIEKMEQKETQTIHKEELAGIMKDILEDAKMQPAMPKWMENLKFYGDLRLRFTTRRQNRVRGGSDQKWRNRFQTRLRFGFTKTWWDNQMEIGFRLATGGDGSIDSANTTWGGGFGKKAISVDLAYAKYKPNWAKGLTFLAGKVKNPLRTKTPITWDSDVNPEGLAIDYEFQVGDFTPYVQAGFWFVNENGTVGEGDNTLRDTILYTISAGATWKINQDMRWFLGGTYYTFTNYNVQQVGGDGADNAWVNSAGEPWADMQLLELTTRFTMKAFNMPLTFMGSWVHNCADDYSANNGGDRDYENAGDAFLVGAKLGQNKKKGDWSVGYEWFWVEMNSSLTVPDNATRIGLGDADYGVNRTGHGLSGKYNIDDFLTISTTLYLTEAINNAPADTDGCRTVLYVDMIWKF